MIYYFISRLGYREWIPKKTSEQGRGKWKIKLAVEAETGKLFMKNG